MLSERSFFIIILLFLVQSVPEISSALSSRRTSFYVVNYKDTPQNNNSSSFETDDEYVNVTNSESVRVNATEHEDVNSLVPLPRIQEAGKNRTSSLMCYYNIPHMNDRPYPVFPEALNASLCSYLVVCGAKVVNETLVPNDLNDVQVIANKPPLKEIPIYNYIELNIILRNCLSQT